MRFDSFAYHENAKSCGKCILFPCSRFSITASTTAWPRGDNESNLMLKSKCFILKMLFQINDNKIWDYKIVFIFVSDAAEAIPSLPMFHAWLRNVDYNQGLKWASFSLLSWLLCFCLSDCCCSRWLLTAILFDGHFIWLL